MYCKKITVNKFQTRSLFCPSDLPLLLFGIPPSYQRNKVFLRCKSGGDAYLMLIQPMHSTPKMEAKKWYQNGGPKKRLSQRASTDFLIDLMRQSQRVEKISAGGVWNGITLPCHENFHQPWQKNTKLDPCSLGTPHRTLQIWCLFSLCIVLPKWKPKNGTKMKARKKDYLKGPQLTFP